MSHTKDERAGDERTGIGFYSTQIQLIEMSIYTWNNNYLNIPEIMSFINRMARSSRVLTQENIADTKYSKFGIYSNI